MLRSGFKSEDVLREVSARHVTEPLDEATKGSLIACGANTQLIAALESGSYRIDSGEAERARAREQEISAAREAEAQRTYRDATATLRQQKSAARAAGTAPADGRSILNILRDKLVVCQDGGTRAPDEARLEQKKLIGFYYSAHWCPPCRKFTPQLVDFYNRVSARHPEFEIVFVSADRSRFNWETYMRDTQMPWLAIDFDRLGEIGPLRENGGPNIPSFVLVDGGGKILARSYVDGKYLGPETVVQKIEEIFAEN